MLSVGIAARDITPPLGTHLAGDGAGLYRPAEEILDPLHAKAIVFDDGQKKACVIALDITILTEDWTSRIRGEAESLGFRQDSVIVHATQTHSAPAMGYFMFDPDFPPFESKLEYLLGSENAYSEFAVQRAIDALRHADANRHPVSLGYGRAVRDDLAFNRRGIRRDGTVCMPWFYKDAAQPLGPVHISHIEGPVDPEVAVVTSMEPSGPMPLMLHHTCHPVNIFATRKRSVSADWPGSWARHLQESASASELPIVINGCCGNINPWPAFTPDFTPDHERMGTALTETSQRILERLQPATSDTLSWLRQVISLPIKEADPELVRAAEQRLQAQPQPPWWEKDPARIDPEWHKAASIYSVELMRRRTSVLDYEIIALRVGDVAVVSLPGEPFVEGQLDLKMRSPAALTLVAHCSTGYVGYLPTREAHRRGGHEVNLSYWAKLAPGALETIVDHASGMLHALWDTAS